MSNPIQETVTFTNFKTKRQDLKKPNSEQQEAKHQALKAHLSTSQGLRKSSKRNNLINLQLYYSGKHARLLESN